MAWIYASVSGSVSIGLVMAVVMILAAFLFSSVAAYMAGLVGSSSNPVSGVTIATIMLAALLLVVFMGAGHPAGPAAALVIGAVVSAISNWIFAWLAHPSPGGPAKPSLQTSAGYAPSPSD